MRTVLLTRQAVAVAAVGGLAVLGISAPAIALSAAHHPGARQAAAHSIARPALPAGQRYVCPPARPGQMTCMSIVRAGHLTRRWASVGITPAQVVYFPKALRKAYRLSTASALRGKGKTIAIVDAFNDPRAASDLAKFRHIFHLPPCTKANGCLHVVNQAGKTRPLPVADPFWAEEISLDLDMVSAICPKCHITLVEAKNARTVNLGTAVNTAVNKGAKFVSNSWGSPGEFLGQNNVSHFFNHPGRVIDFASGDLGYGPTFPADLQYVTSVGGTTLRRTTGGRGWTESVWGSSTSGHGTASGCSNGEAMPSWQFAVLPNGCTTRTQNDVAAVANPDTGVAVYDSYRQPIPYLVFGGTSVSTPIITAIYALAGNPKARTYPAEYAYLRKGHLFDVTTGANGTCGPRPYLCTGEPGYDGPTGLGTPNGIAAFGVRAGRMVTVVDPGRQAGQHGHAFSVKIVGLDSRRVSSLRYSATGLPRGLSIRAVPHSTNARISGTIRGTAGTYHVTVTARDGTAKGTTHFNIVVH